jgi:hypothetical protein
MGKHSGIHGTAIGKNQWRGASLQQEAASNRRKARP